jgi:hypothetical protein
MRDVPLRSTVSITLDAPVFGVVRRECVAGSDPGVSSDGGAHEEHAARQAGRTAESCAPKRVGKDARGSANAAADSARWRQQTWRIAGAEHVAEPQPGNASRDFSGLDLGAAREGAHGSTVDQGEIGP